MLPPAVKTAGAKTDLLFSYVDMGNSAVHVLKITPSMQCGQCGVEI
jgi:hypothetical protein